MQRRSLRDRRFCFLDKNFIRLQGIVVFGQETTEVALKKELVVSCANVVHVARSGLGYDAGNVAADLAALWKQFSETKRTKEQFRAWIDEKFLKSAGERQLFLAYRTSRDKDETMTVSRCQVIGMASLFAIPSAGGAWGLVEDVVVHKKYRGMGVGKKLMKIVIEWARIMRLETIELTSRPSRVAANKMYKALGFVRRKTNHYEMKLK